MRRFIILVFCGLILTSCSKVETTPSVEETLIIQNNKIVVSPTVQETSPLKPVKPNVKLDAKQEKYLSESLPPQVREILEKAEKFEVLAEVRKKEFHDNDESIIFEPNRIAKITREQDKEEILEALYHDAARVDALSACFYPYHKLRAIYHEKTVEVEICFKCSKFVVESPFGRFFGIIVREDRKSESILNRIIRNQSIELK